MAKRELAKAYNPQEVEDKWYEYWLKNGYFYAKVNPDKKPYTIVMPPPNITGVLTLGHVLNNTIQDIYIRWKRMQGYEACWIPGTDHAGIATQNVVEKALAKEGLRREDLGREKFLERVWQWKEEYGNTIIKQLKKLGVSCDWKRERFTMDEGLSNAVKEVFIRLYEKGLIYRGKYIVNWCPRCHTALADDEVEHKEQNGKLWYIKYPIENSQEFITVATTRPETMLGDTAVAVNPKDERYKHLIGKFAILPLVWRKLPIISDESVDMEFGTGAVKVTPAHDPNDYLLAIKHNLEFVVVMDTYAKMNENVPEKYRFIDRYEARKEVVKDLETYGYLAKVEDYTHAVGRCYRCDTVIEPYLSDQWFVKMKPLAEKALQVVLDGKIKFYPERWVKVYEHWMRNVRDWCISRQIWWGHRIPVYYCDDCREIMVEREEPKSCKKCGSTKIRQDEDVLDTWFSSWLWPFSTLNWPEDNADLRYFYPTDLLVTGPDIIFFWVARMIMAGLEFMGEIPFKEVYFTSIIRDEFGRKMSKSLGNSPDPLDVIQEYGADALRFTIVYLAPLGQDILFSTKKCEIGRNFANKIWNAGRFLIMNLDEVEYKDEAKFDHLDIADKWILSELNKTIKELNYALETYRINDATRTIYDFLWHDFCDWYLEIIKDRIYSPESKDEKIAVLSRAVYIFETALKLLHPFMPFITEEIWQNIRERKEGESIMIEPFPTFDEKWIDDEISKNMKFIQDIIVAVRSIRGEMNIPHTKFCDVIINTSNNDRKNLVNEYISYIKRLAKVQNVTVGSGIKRPQFSASAVVAGDEIFVPLEGLIDLEIERKRLEKEIKRYETMLSETERKLNDHNFINRAPADVIERERQKYENFKLTLEKLRQNYAYLVE
ncbi:MAG: valine--tRNA ligase [Candidatus Kryptonium sp.]|nr:valine--tRNA ligase [Candidatus Kryptonium sp.]MDW8109334.1 valine--tRNA ligase [Candidatus Kryptonium sp.]